MLEKVQEKVGYGFDRWNPKVHLITLASFCKNSIRDAHTPRPGEILFNTMRYRSDTVDQDTFRANSLSYIKVQMMFM